MDMKEHMVLITTMMATPTFPPAPILLPSTAAQLVRLSFTLLAAKLSGRNLHHTHHRNGN